MWTHTVAHRWGLPDLMIDLVGCGLVTTLDTARQMSVITDGLPELMVVHVADVARWLHWTRPYRCLPWKRKNLMCDCWGSKYKKVPFPMTVAIRPRSQSDYKQPIKESHLHVKRKALTIISCTTYWFSNTNIVDNLRILIYETFF